MCNLSAAALCVYVYTYISIYNIYRRHSYDVRVYIYICIYMCVSIYIYIYILHNYTYNIPQAFIRCAIYLQQHRLPNDTYSKTNQHTPHTHINETWGSGGRYSDFEPLSSFLQFRTHFLLRFILINYRYDAPIKWYLTICNTETLYGNLAPVMMKQTPTSDAH